ncbi:MAG: ankyrin repeat domain-containing protein [Terriglobales bacterium]|jgi:hypothetical protein
MTTMRLYAALLLGIVTMGVAWQRAEAKHKKDQDNAQVTDTEKLASAAESCDMPTLKALIASGVNFNAKNANGYNALSRASLNRFIQKGWRKVKGGKINWWTLVCSSAVTALTEAGADPWKASFYQNPRLDENRPAMIAVIRVEDNREKKGDSDKIIDEMTDAVETQLHGHHWLNLGYPILGLNEVRQKLRTFGFSAEDTMAPDRTKACKALAVDSVFEASLEDFQGSSIGVVSASEMRMKFTLTDCQTGALLWRSHKNHWASEGALFRAFAGGKVKQMITGVEGSGILPAVSFPASPLRYEKGEK